MTACGEFVTFDSGRVILPIVEFVALFGRRPLLISRSRRCDFGLTS
jgi:hypothetical protein